MFINFRSFFAGAASLPQVSGAIVGDVPRGDTLEAFGYSFTMPTTGTLSPMISAQNSATIKGRMTATTGAGSVPEVAVSTTPEYIDVGLALSAGDTASYTFYDGADIYRLELIVGTTSDVMIVEKIGSVPAAVTNPAPPPISGVSTIGVRPVESTPVANGTLFASPAGTGTGTELTKNISSEDAQYFWNSNGIFVDNSWDRNGNTWNNPGIVPFVNTTDPSHPDFLRPAPGIGYEDIGAYA